MPLVPPPRDRRVEICARFHQSRIWASKSYHRTAVGCLSALMRCGEIMLGGEMTKQIEPEKIDPVGQAQAMGAT